MKEGSFFCTSSLSYIICRLFNDGHSDRCEVIIPVLISIALIMSNVEHVFMFVSQLYVFFGEMSKSFSLFDWVVCFSRMEWYELVVYFVYMSVASFSIFSHHEGCLFTLLLVSFAVQKLLSLIKSHLFIFVFISITLGGGS